MNNEKAKGVYQEMLNSIVHADADMARAKAQELATDYSTGKIVNWKNVLEAGATAVSAVGGAAGGFGKFVNTKIPKK